MNNDSTAIAQHVSYGFGQDEAICIYTDQAGWQWLAFGMLGEWLQLHSPDSVVEKGMQFRVDILGAEGKTLKGVTVWLTAQDHRPSIMRIDTGKWFVISPDQRVLTKGGETLPAKDAVGKQLAHFRRQPEPSGEKCSMGDIVTKVTPPTKKRKGEDGKVQYADFMTMQGKQKGICDMWAIDIPNGEFAVVSGFLFPGSICG